MSEYIRPGDTVDVAAFGGGYKLFKATVIHTPTGARPEWVFETDIAISHVTTGCIVTRRKDPSNQDHSNG